MSSPDPSDLDFVKEGTTPNDDQEAKEEGKFYAAQAKRKDSEKQTIHQIFTIAIWIIFWSAIILTFVLGWHYIMPKCFRWLCPDDLSSLEYALKSGLLGVLGALLGKYGNTLFK